MRRRITCGNCTCCLLAFLILWPGSHSYHGGWLAPNIYFLGHAGCIQVNGLRIAGASGIFKGHDFRKGKLLYLVHTSLLHTMWYFAGYYERLPYTSSSLRSIYHIREFNVRRLSLVCFFTNNSDVLIDWIINLTTAFSTDDLHVPWLATIYWTSWKFEEPLILQEIPSIWRREW